MGAVASISGASLELAYNKNQHFVPRCHLNPFAKVEASVPINLLNLTRAAAISYTPAKNQSSQDYFYSVPMCVQTEGPKPRLGRFRRVTYDGSSQSARSSFRLRESNLGQTPAFVAPFPGRRGADLKSQGREMQFQRARHVAGEIWRVGGYANAV